MSLSFRTFMKWKFPLVARFLIPTRWNGSHLHSPIRSFFDMQQVVCFLLNVGTNFGAIFISGQHYRKSVPNRICNILRNNFPFLITSAVSFPVHNYGQTHKPGLSVSMFVSMPCYRSIFAYPTGDVWILLRHTFWFAVYILGWAWSHILPFSSIFYTSI